MNAVVLSSLSTGLSKALGTNSVAPDWATDVFIPRATPAVIDGLWSATATQTGNVMSPTRLFIMPFASGMPGSQFAMRVWGWREFTQYEGDGPRQLSLPYLIAEFAFMTGSIPGPQGEGPGGVPSLRPLLPSENLVDTGILVQGDLGPSGWMNMTGGVYGPDLPGYVLLELQGSRRFQFDFKQVDQIEMNAFWCRA